MLDVLREEGIKETMDAYVVKFFDTNVAAGNLSKNLLTSSSCEALISTFLRRKTDSTIADQNTVTCKATKRSLWQPLKHRGALSMHGQGSLT